MLKAASIIVEHDEKHFTYNPAIVEDLDNSNQSEEELIEHRLMVTGDHLAKNLSF